MSMLPMIAGMSAWRRARFFGLALSKVFRGWNASGISLDPFKSIRPMSFTAGRVVYYFGDDVAASVSIVTYAKEVATAYSSAVSELSLARGIGSTDAHLGGLLYFPSGFYSVRTYVEIIGGWSWARADAEAFGTVRIPSHQAERPGGTGLPTSW